MSTPAALDANTAAHAAPARRRSRAGLWGLGFVLLLAAALWAGVALTQHLAASGAVGAAVLPGWSPDFEVVVNGERWSLAEGFKDLIGWSIAALVIGGLLLVALALLPVTLGLVAMLVLLPLGLVLVLALVALPVLLVLGLLLSPLLLLGGLAWMIFG